MWGDPFFNLLFALWLLMFVLGIWAALDAALRPNSAWDAADQSKVVWVIVPLFLPLVGPLAYFFAVRPKIRRQGDLHK